MKVLKQHGILPVLIILLNVQCVEGIPYSRTSMSLTGLSVLIALIIYKMKYFAVDNKKDYLIIWIYFLWMLSAGVIRGFIVVENINEMKDVFSGICLASLPIIVYVYTKPALMWKTLHLWIWFVVPAFFLFYIWILPYDQYQFYFGPLFLMCFIPVLPKKWKIFGIFFMLLMMFADFGARSQMTKALIVVLICIGYYFRKWIPLVLFSIVHWLCYIVPIVILYLAITGVFNPLEYMAESESMTYDIGNEYINADTRTILYEETILSAVKNDYIWHGRSLARGNDSWHFGAFTDEQLKTKRYERYGNEWCHPNVFTWLGLIGVFLFFFIYLKSSFMALYRSNNIWMKFLSMFIAFNWAWGWLENCLVLDVLNIGIWMMIAMGFSKQFRAMSDKEIEKWVNSIFKWKYEKDIVA